MNQQEAAALLGVAAAFDNRKPDPDAALAWAAALDGLRFEDCRDAIVAHYRASSDWLMPQAVIAAAQSEHGAALDRTVARPKPPSSSGSGRRPFKAVAPVRIRSGVRHVWKFPDVEPHRPVRRAANCAVVRELIARRAQTSLPPWSNGYDTGLRSRRSAFDSRRGHPSNLAVHCCAVRGIEAPARSDNT